MENEYKVKSLAKAMHVLECFSLGNPELGVTELAKMTGMQKSSVHNVLATFMQMGYVQRNIKTEKYSLGLNLLCFSFHIMNNLKIRQLLMPYIMQVAAKTGQTCMLAVPHNFRVFYIDASLSPDSERSMRHIAGEQAPFYCTALGKAMLAFMPMEQIEWYLQNESFVKCTQYTLTNPQHFREQLAEIGRNGYAVDNMEHEYGIRCVGVPLFDVNQKIVGAISISGPASDFTPTAIDAYASYIKEIISPVQNYIIL